MKSTVNTEESKKRRRPRGMDKWSTCHHNKGTTAGGTRGVDDRLSSSGQRAVDVSHFIEEEWRDPSLS